MVDLDYGDVKAVKAFVKTFNFDKFAASQPPLEPVLESGLEDKGDMMSWLKPSPVFEAWRRHIIDTMPLPYFVDTSNATYEWGWGEYEIRKTFLSFLRLATKQYVKNPKDFLASYYFLEKHPIFWSVRGSHQCEHSPSADEKVRWDFSNGVRKLELLMMVDGGRPVFAFEAGPHRDDYPHGCHDLKLDVYAKTYEKGIIKMAALVHKFYDLEGRDREGVEYQKSELEITLDDAVARMDETLAKRREATADEEPQQ